MFNGINFYLVIFGVSAFFCGVQEIFAQQESGKPPFVERMSVTVRVVDPDGSPVEGATVVPSGAVTVNLPSGEMSWMDDQPDLVKGLVTNEKGEVTLSWPKKLYEIFEPTNIRIRVNHSSFVAFSQSFSTGDNPFQVVLERGFQAAVSAVDAVSGDAIDQDLFATTNQIRSEDWTAKKDGTIISPVFGDDENCFRLIQIVDGKALRFSELIHVDPAQRSRFLMRDIKMHESVNVRGKLDEQVTRPVRNGFVIACAVSIRDEDRIKYHSAWSWSEFARVAEDGTFELKGLPADTPLQVIAMRDGWTNAPLTNDEFNSNFSSQRGNRARFPPPQLIPVEKFADGPTIAMQRAGSCKIKVVDEDGKPIAKASVAMNPNQVFYHTGYSTGFGSGRSSSLLTWQIRNPTGPEVTFETNPAYHSVYSWEAETDDEGIAVIENLPESEGSGFAAHPMHRAANGGYQEMFGANWKSGIQSEVTVTLHKAKDPEKEESLGKDDDDGK